MKSSMLQLESNTILYIWDMIVPPMKSQPIYKGECSIYVRPLSPYPPIAKSVAYALNHSQSINLSQRIP